MEVGTVLLSVFAAIVYSLSMYVKKATKEKPDKFDFSDVKNLKYVRNE